MCALGLGWPSLWVPQRRPQTSQRGNPKEDPPKGQKSRDQIKTQSSSKDPWGNLNLPGTGWPQRSFPALRILWVNFLCPPFYSLQGVCQDFFLVGPAAPGKRLPSPTPPLYPEHHPGCREPGWAGAENNCSCDGEWFLCFLWKAGAPHREMALGVIWDPGSNSCSQISQIRGAGR